MPKNVPLFAVGGLKGMFFQETHKYAKTRVRELPKTQNWQMVRQN
jgi:hypothetical protein